MAATWLMMALEGPFLAAIIARLPDPKFNLAAHGVSLAFAILIEAPVIMILSASTALVEDSHSFRKLRNFTFTLNAIVTVAMVSFLIPPVFRFVIQGLVGLPDEVAHLTYGALWIFLPWPAAIGYRRFFQGLLIRSGRTRLVAYGTIIRLVTMSTTAMVLFGVFTVPGAYAGAAALSIGVCVEAVAGRLMAQPTVHQLLSSRAEKPPRERLSYRHIADFYYPLALTSLIGLAVQPMLTFFMGRAPSPVESLAVFPVVHALSFVFRAMGLSYQEVAIALLGKDLEHSRELSNFAWVLGIASSAALAAIAFTPFARVWFETVSGLSPELTSFAITPIRILVLLPVMSVLLSYQRALLVKGHLTGPITWATVLEIAGVALVFTLLSRTTELTGVTAAVVAFIIGRLAGNLYLIPPCIRVLAASR